VLRVTDGRTGRLVDVPAVRGGLLTLRVRPACDGGTAGVGDVRTLLVADVLLRAVEADGAQVMHDVVLPPLDPEEAAVLDRARSALGLHPPSGGFGPARVEVVGGAPDDGDDGAVRVTVGPVRPDGTALLPGDGDEDADDPAGPLALRLALLAHPHQAPVSVTEPGLAEAARTLRTWRRHVARWADTPSRPVPDGVLRRYRTAIAEDLGTPAALDVLRHIEAATDIPDGAKFETFAHADRILGLELTRDIGRV
jgi:hypothetical protein